MQKQVNPICFPVFPDKPTVYRDKLAVYRDKLTVYADKLAVYAGKSAAACEDATPPFRQRRAEGREETAEGRKEAHREIRCASITIRQKLFDEPDNRHAVPQRLVGITLFVGPDGHGLDLPGIHIISIHKRIANRARALVTQLLVVSFRP